MAAAATDGGGAAGDDRKAGIMINKCLMVESGVSQLVCYTNLTGTHLFVLGVQVGATPEQ